MDPQDPLGLDYRSIVQPFITTLEELQASQIESSIGGNTPGMLPARYLHLASDAHVEACETFATSRRMPAGDGEYRGATVKPKLINRLREIEEKTSCLVQDCNPSWPETTRDHLVRRLDLLQRITQVANIAADPHGYKMSSCADTLEDLAPSIASYPDLCRQVSGFATETQKLANGDRAYASEDIRECLTDLGDLQQSQSQGGECDPAIEALRFSATIIGETFNAALESAEDENRGALASVLETMFDLDDAMRPHLWDMYGIPIAEEESDE